MAKTGETTTFTTKTHINGLTRSDWNALHGHRRVVKVVSLSLIIHYFLYSSGKFRVFFLSTTSSLTCCNTDEGQNKERYLGHRPAEHLHRGAGLSLCQKSSASRIVGHCCWLIHWTTGRHVVLNRQAIDQNVKFLVFLIGQPFLFSSSSALFCRCFLVVAWFGHLPVASVPRCESLYFAQASFFARIQNKYVKSQMTAKWHKHMSSNELRKMW